MRERLYPDGSSPASSAKSRRAAALPMKYALELLEAKQKSRHVNSQNYSNSHMENLIQQSSASWSRSATTCCRASVAVVMHPPAPTSR